MSFPQNPYEGQLYPESTPRYQYIGGKWVGYSATVTLAEIGAAPAAKGVTNGDNHDHSGGDGAQIDYSTLSGKPVVPDSPGDIGAAASDDIRFPCVITQAAYDALGSVTTTDGKLYCIFP